MFVGGLDASQPSFLVTRTNLGKQKFSEHYPRPRSRRYWTSVPLGSPRDSLGGPGRARREVHHLFVARYEEGDVVMAETDDGRWMEGVIVGANSEAETSPPPFPPPEAPLDFLEVPAAGIIRSRTCCFGQHPKHFDSPVPGDHSTRADYFGDPVMFAG